MSIKSSKLTQIQRSILNEIATSLCVNNGIDGFYANKRTLDSLESKGLIFYGRFPPEGPTKEVGWQVTEQGKTLNAFLNLT